MERDQFEELSEILLAKAKELRFKKGRDYQRATQDILSNFKTGAEKLRITILQDFGVLFNKQTEAIFAYLATGELESEGIEGRMLDVINYTLLLNGIVHEIEKSRKD